MFSFDEAPVADLKFRFSVLLRCKLKKSRCLLAVTTSIFRCFSGSTETSLLAYPGKYKVVPSKSRLGVIVFF